MGIQVEFNLDLCLRAFGTKGRAIEECLPEGLEVGGDLNLYGCTSLTSLPEGLEVGGGLNLPYCTSLTSLPEGLEIGGDLYVDDDIEIPENAVIKGKIIK